MESHSISGYKTLKKNMSAHVWGDIGIMIKQKFHLAQLNLAELIDVSMAFRGVSFLCHILFFDWQVKIFSLQGKSEQSKYIWELICTLCVNGSSIRWDHNGNWQNLNSWHNIINNISEVLRDTYTTFYGEMPSFTRWFMKVSSVL